MPGTQGRTWLGHRPALKCCPAYPPAAVPAYLPALAIRVNGRHRPTDRCNGVFAHFGWFGRGILAVFRRILAGLGGVFWPLSRTLAGLHSDSMLFLTRFDWDTG